MNQLRRKDGKFAGRAPELSRIDIDRIALILNEPEPAVVPVRAYTEDETIFIGAIAFLAGAVVIFFCFYPFTG